MESYTELQAYSSSEGEKESRLYVTEIELPARSPITMMSSWLPFLADVLIASSHEETISGQTFPNKYGDSQSVHHHHHQKSGHRKPLCYSPEGYGPISTIRQFDFTPCFESAAVLPLPLVILLVAGIWDVVRVGRKGPRRKRTGWSKARLWMKMVSTKRLVAAIVPIISALTFWSFHPRRRPLIRSS